MRFDIMGIAPRLPPSPSQVEEAQTTHELKSRAMHYGPTQRGNAAAANDSGSNNVTAAQPLSSATLESREKNDDDKEEALQQRTSQLQSYATSDHHNGIHSRRPHRRRSSRRRSSSPSSAAAVAAATAAEASTSKQRLHSHSVDGGASPPEQRSPTEKAAAAAAAQTNDYDDDDEDDVHSSSRSYISTSEYDEDAVGAIDPPARKRYRDRPDDYDDDEYYDEQHKRRNAKHAAMMSEPSEQTHDVGVESDKARHRLGDAMPTSMAGGSSEQAKSVVKTEEGSNSALSSRQSTLPSLSSLPPPQHSHSPFPPRASPAVGAAQQQQQQRRWRSPSPTASLPAMTNAQQQPTSHSAVRHRRVTPTPLVEEEHEHLEGILRAANTMSRFVSRIGRDGFVPELSAGSEWDEVNENLRVAVRRVDILNKRWLSTATTTSGSAGQAALITSMSRSTSVPYQLANEGDGGGGPFAFRHAPPPSHRISTSALTHLPPPPGVRSPPDRFVASQYDFAARTPSTTTARHSTGAVRSTLSNLPPPPPPPGGAASSSSAYHRSPPPGGGSEWYNVRQSDGISRPLHLRSSSWQNQGQPQYIVGRAPADRRIEWNGAEAQQHRSLYTGDAHHHDDRVAPTGMPGLPSSEYGGRASRFPTTTTATAFAAAPNAPPPHLPMPHAGSSTRGGGFAAGYRAAPSDSMYYETDDGTNGGGVDGIASGSNHQSASASGSGGGGSLRPSKYRKRSRAPAPGRCLSCAASDTPEWRRGPTGARTLCNACGLQYSKLIRRKRQDERDPEAEVSMDELRQSLKLYTPA